VRIVVDSSALLAVLLHEPKRDRFIAALLDSQPVISIATLTETSLVLLGRRGAAALDEPPFGSKLHLFWRTITWGCAKRCSSSAKAGAGHRRC
jgi:uncharacterized protein with PIN domain